ncbi:hypothetical protein Dimus_024117 [Dionaea muscipula]
MRLEEALENGLTGIRERQASSGSAYTYICNMDIYKMHRKNVCHVEEEHKQLTYMDMMDGNMREIENGHGYHQEAAERDHYHHQQLPFLFRMQQPMQPNLQ